MIAEKALRLAGPGAVLCRRPRSDVRHVYVGPLTPSGRYVPRAGRTVCRAHTRRLQVASDTAPSLCAHRRRVCARCSARLTRRLLLPGDAQAGQQHRDHYTRAYAGLTRGDFAVQLLLAETPVEVDAVAHASLARFGVAATMQPFLERGRSWPSLHHLTHAARARVGGFDHTFHAQLSDKARALSVMAREQRARERAEAWQQREARIERLGINNARPRR